jgi:hypothetical protein
MENVKLYTMTNDAPIKTAIAKFDNWRGLFQSNCELAVRRENGLSNCQNDQRWELRICNWTKCWPEIDVLSLHYSIRKS